MEKQNILNFMGNTKELILIYDNMQPISPKDSIDIILTPYFYTLKKETLPVKYSYQAKSIASSLFDGILDNLDEYRYFVNNNRDNEWIFIAYNPNKIKEFLEEKGISLKFVSKVYFIDQYIDRLSKPILLGEKDALVNLNQTAVIVPQLSLNKDEKSMKIDKSFTPKRGISLGETTSFISTTQSMVISLIFTIFATIFMIEGFRYSSQNIELENKIEAILDRYPSLASSYTRESIASKYKRIDKQEREKRNIVKKLSQMVSKGVIIDQLLVDNHKFSAKFISTNQLVIKKLKRVAKEEKFKVKNSSDRYSLELEGKL